MKANKCLCGCGKEVNKKGNKYIFNHHRINKKYTKERNINMSNIMKKIWADPSHKLNSEESRIKRSNSSKGSKPSIKGNKNPNWKGGISCEPYCDIWLDKEYKQSIRDRDGNKCLNPDCNGKSKKLHLHHINYNKKDCIPTNLITVCNSCNTRANKDREWHQSWYKAIIYRRYLCVV